MIAEGLIGENCQFKTYPELIRYILDNITQLNNFKEKNIIDLKSYKNKLESLLITFRTQIDNIMKTMTQFTNKSINESENKIKGIISIYDERLVEIRAQNNNYIKTLTDKYENLMKEWETILEIKKEIYSKIDNDLLNINNSVNKYYQEFKDDNIKYNNKLFNLNEEIQKIKTNLQNARERQLNYSKKISLRKSKKAFDEDYLFTDLKENNSLNINIEKKNLDKWKKYVQNSFNKVIQQKNIDINNDSNIYGVNTNEKKERKTLSFGALKFKKSNNNRENKLLNIKEHFDSINEGKNELKNYIELKNYNIQNEEENNSDLLSNKTIDDDYENNENLKNNKENKSNKEIKINGISNKIGYSNYKNNIINNNKSKLSNNKINNSRDNSQIITENKKNDQINDKDIHKILNNNMNNSMIKEEHINKKILISKEINNSEIELPKIDENKKYNSTDQEPEEKIIIKLKKKI